LSTFESKLTAVGFGFLIPFFFITSGINFDLDALTSSAGTMLKLPMFLALFLVVRGLPALLLYRRVLGSRDRVALAFLSATALPLVVAITTIATQTGPCARRRRPRWSARRSSRRSSSRSWAWRCGGRSR
jgi:Kef-type K+ transport system membrane component KefB